MSPTNHSAPQLGFIDTVKQRVRKWLVLRFNRVAYLPIEDRRILETVILPDLSRRPELCRVLSVGCAWYAEGYERFFARKECLYWTIDIDADMARFGASGGRHIVGSVENIAHYFEPDSLDLVICNGVFGWGLDEEATVTQAFEGFFRVLRPEGLLLLGWNDVPEHRPLDPLRLMNACGFHPYSFEPLASAQFLTDTDNRHLFNFYVKPNPAVL